MQERNFILTDVMKTGSHADLEQYINMHSLPDQTFDMTGEYYTLYNYNLDSYDRKIAFITRDSVGNTHPSHNPEYVEELDKRCKLLLDRGFKFVYTSPWESLENIKEMNIHPAYDSKQMSWTGGVSWFWFYMYRKHLNHQFKFTHDCNNIYWKKKHDFLYLNKAPRKHRIDLYNRFKQTDVLDNSIYTFSMLNEPIRLEKKYELPGIDPEYYPRFGKDQDISQMPYNDTACSIVSETNVNDYDVFMTEKIWKAIIAKHVFIVYGNHLYLYRLRQMGFKTFRDYFDEGYDLEQDPYKRIDKIVALCKDLKKNKNWQDIYQQTQSLRQHNHDTFFNKEKLSLEINNTLELFLKFAD